MSSHQPAALAPGLIRRQLGTFQLSFYTISASAPLTVLGGGVVATLAVTGNLGTPLSFLVLGVVLAVWAVGYTAMSRHLDYGGAFYTYLARGLGGVWGVSGAAVALVAYNAIQIGLYGLFGVVASAFAEAQFSLAWSWYAWAAIAWAVVGLLGLFKVDLSAKVLGVLLVAEVAAVAAFDIGGFGHPAAGSISWQGLSPGELIGPGLGIVFALSTAAFVGFESGPVYSAEAKDPRRTVARATYIAVGFTSIFYCLSALALIVAAGPDQVAGMAQDPTSGLPFNFIEQYYGHSIAVIANCLLATSVFAALLSFHNVVARYTWSAGHEGVLPRFTAATSRRTGAPMAGSLLQSLLAAIVVAVFVALDKDPMAHLFTWLSYIAALGILLLMIGTSLAVVGYFRKSPSAAESAWHRTVAPVLAAVALAAIVIVTAANADALLNAEPGSLEIYVMPGIIVLTALVGIVWGLALRASDPRLYAGIGGGGTEQPAAEDGLGALLQARAAGGDATLTGSGDATGIHRRF
ncbi:APC family permease [Dactylosporangium sp. NPDC000521]|uniref:APC family permease n=1 Tax=Dactylosporangium sp. NPDC000521 TaxID=3363975 RepID=UPI0036BD0FFC